jgi:hypothetical protein
MRALGIALALAAAVAAPSAAAQAYLVRLETKPGFMPNPHADTLTIYPDGGATLRVAPPAGPTTLRSSTFHLTAAALARVKAQVSAAGFPGLASSYGKAVPDTGADYLDSGGRRILVEGLSSPPAPLRNLLRSLQSILASHGG